MKWMAAPSPLNSQRRTAKLPLKCVLATGQMILVIVTETHLSEESVEGGVILVVCPESAESILQQEMVMARETVRVAIMEEILKTAMMMSLLCVRGMMMSKTRRCPLVILIPHKNAYCPQLIHEYYTSNF
jgi:hypothetical protein